MYENLDLRPRHHASHSRTSTGNIANPVPPCRTARRSVTHPEPLVAELPFTNVAAELSSFQGPVELPVSTDALEAESQRIQSSIAAPRYAFSGYSNGDRGTTEPEKEKKRDELEKLTRKQQPRERDKAGRVQDPILCEVRRKQDAIQVAAIAEYKREQKIMEALKEKEREREKKKENEKNEWLIMKTRLKALGYTDEEIDDIINKRRKGKRERREMEEMEVQNVVTKTSLLHHDVSASYYVADEEDQTQFEVPSNLSSGYYQLGGGSVNE